MDKDKTQSSTADRTAKKNLGEMLIEENLITPEQLRALRAKLSKSRTA